MDLNYFIDKHSYFMQNSENITKIYNAIKSPDKYSSLREDLGLNQTETPMSKSEKRTNVEIEKQKTLKKLMSLLDSLKLEDLMEVADSGHLDES